MLIYEYGKLVIFNSTQLTLKSGISMDILIVTMLFLERINLLESLNIGGRALVLYL